MVDVNVPTSRPSAGRTNAYGYQSRSDLILLGQPKQDRRTL